MRAFAAEYAAPFESPSADAREGKLRRVDANTLMFVGLVLLAYVEITSREERALRLALPFMPDACTMKGCRRALSLSLIHI